jgi:transposase
MKAYSLDLRMRVVDFVEAGDSRHAAAAHFGVSVSFVVKLVTAFRSTGSYAPKPEGGWRYSKLDPHRAFLERRVAEKADITMTELAGEFAAIGLQIDQASLSRWYRRNGYRYKKKPFGQRTRSPRRGSGAARMGDETPTADAA